MTLDSIGKIDSLPFPGSAIARPGMKSMTGYGWGECAEDGFKVTVELSSVNRKQSEISMNLPRELEVLEAQVRDEINGRVARGRVTARVSLDLIMRAPGVLQSNEEMADAEHFWPAVEKALREALAMLVTVRQREGDVLRKDLSKRIAVMRQALAQKQAPQVQKRYREQLIERIKGAGIADMQIEEDRLVKEVVYFADRSD